jgi:uncharacterized protein
MSNLSVNAERLEEVCRRFAVQRLQLFGSSATNSAKAGSDIDLMVEFIPGKAPGAFALIDLQDELSALFGGRPVDLAFPSILRNPYRRRVIEQQLRPLFG